MTVRIKAANTVDPSDGPVARNRALCIVWVDEGGGGGRLGSAKYQAAMTLAVVMRITPRETPQLHSHTRTVLVIDQFAHPRTCHSQPLFAEDVAYPMSNSLKIRVRKGNEAIKVARRTTGDRANRKGLAIRRCVVRVKVEDVV